MCFFIWFLYSIGLEIENVDTWILIGEPSRKQPGIHCKRCNIIVCMTGVYECRKFLECCKYLSSNDSLITIVGVIQCDKKLSIIIYNRTLEVIMTFI